MAISGDLTNRSSIGNLTDRRRTQRRFALMEYFPNHSDKSEPVNLSATICSDGRPYNTYSTAEQYFVARHGYWTDICGLAFADVVFPTNAKRKRIYFFAEEPERIAVELYIVPFKQE